MQKRLKIISAPRVHIKREAVEICLERSDIIVTSYRGSPLNDVVEEFGSIVRSDYAPMRKDMPMYVVDFPTPVYEDPITLLERERETAKATTLVCPMCNQSFNFRSRLKHHVAIRHLNLKNFKCNICQKKFKLKHHLKYHIKTHEKKKWHSKNILIDAGSELVEQEVVTDEDECYNYEFLAEGEDVKIEIERFEQEC